MGKPDCVFCDDNAVCNKVGGITGDGNMKGGGAGVFLLEIKVAIVCCRKVIWFDNAVTTDCGGG